MNPIIIAISGGSGSGKTYLAKKFAEKYPKKKILIINQDSYYKDISHMLFNDRKKQNFDHPNAIDIELLQKNIRELKTCKEAELPSYNFKRHLRRKKTKKVKKSDVIIIEGILILHFLQLRKFYTLKIYVDTPEKIRRERRLKRDMEERGRTEESINKQYEDTVKPMHNQFVESSKVYADLIIKGTEEINKNIKLIQSKLNPIF